MRCPVCQSDNTRLNLSMPGIPVHGKKVWTTRQEARSAPLSDINLRFCYNCIHLYNESFDPLQAEFQDRCGGAFQHSSRLGNYLRSLAEDLIARHRLRGRSVLEIGTGPGELSRLLSELGKNEGSDLDSDTHFALHSSTNGRSRSLTDLRSLNSIEGAADLICGRQVLEHSFNPNDILGRLRMKIGKRSQTIVFFEVPNLMHAVWDLGIWDIIYENCSYFSSFSLSELFARNGFQVAKVEETFGAQYLTIEAVAGNGGHPPSREDAGERTQMVDAVEVFSENFRGKLDGWRLSLRTLKNRGHRIVVWGSGAKGATFANLLRDEDAIDYFVDINPCKQDKFVSGTGQLIRSPEGLLSHPADTVIVMNSNYEEEIQEILQNLGVKSQIMLA